MATTGAPTTLTASDHAFLYFIRNGRIVGRPGGSSTLGAVHLHLSRVPTVVQAGSDAYGCAAPGKIGAPLPPGDYQIVAALRVITTPTVAITNPRVYGIASAPANFVLT